jgi:hypothetical protein
MEQEKKIAKVAVKLKLHERHSDLDYWQAQPPSARLEALESIRREFHQWRYGAEPRLQRVYTISKRK